MTLTLLHGTTDDSDVALLSSQGAGRRVLVFEEGIVSLTVHLRIFNDKVVEPGVWGGTTVGAMPGGLFDAPLLRLPPALAALLDPLSPGYGAARALMLTAAADALAAGSPSGGGASSGAAGSTSSSPPSSMLQQLSRSGNLTLSMALSALYGGLFEPSSELNGRASPSSTPLDSVRTAELLAAAASSGTGAPALHGTGSCAACLGVTANADTLARILTSLSASSRALYTRIYNATQPPYVSQWQATLGGSAAPTLARRGLSGVAVHDASTQGALGLELGHMQRGGWGSFPGAVGTMDDSEAFLTISPHEWARVELSHPCCGGFLGEFSSAMVAIIDDDAFGVSPGATTVGGLGGGASGGSSALVAYTNALRAAGSNQTVPSSLPTLGDATAPPHASLLFDSVLRGSLGVSGAVAAGTLPGTTPLPGRIAPLDLSVYPMAGYPTLVTFFPRDSSGRVLGMDARFVSYHMASTNAPDLHLATSPLLEVWGARLTPLAPFASTSGKLALLQLLKEKLAEVLRKVSLAQGLKAWGGLTGSDASRGGAAPAVRGAAPSGALPSNLTQRLSWGTSAPSLPPLHPSAMELPWTLQGGGEDDFSVEAFPMVWQEGLAEEGAFPFPPTSLPQATSSVTPPDTSGTPPTEDFSALLAAASAALAAAGTSPTSDVFMEELSSRLAEEVSGLVLEALAPPSTSGGGHNHPYPTLPPRFSLCHQQGYGGG